LAIRYPRAGRVIFASDNASLVVGKWEYLHRATGAQKAKISVLAAGERCLIIAMKILKNLQGLGMDFDVINARFVKPLDEGFIQNTDSDYVITLEDNVFNGGFGQALSVALINAGKTCKIKNYAYHDVFIPQGGVSSLQSQFGVNCKEIEEYIKSVFE
jgi:1-deoxy-D-xylulose-5-phosphate synthase